MAAAQALAVPPGTDRTPGAKRHQPRCRLLRFSGLSALLHTSGIAMFHLLLRPGLPPHGPPLTAAAFPSPPPTLGLPPPPSPLAPLLALRAATSSSAKDVGGSPEKAATDLSSENKKLNKSQQLKKVFKECGAVGVSFHVGISLVFLGIFYLAVSPSPTSDLTLTSPPLSHKSLQSKRAAGTGTFLLAYAIRKLFAPVQISITIVSVPFIVRYCWKIVFLKSPIPNP
uniref:DUF1279 domain-containing protein n=1 Tax=Anas platyrhynchos TaxID=8839 RepID=A0A8B9THK1_ANAPL